MFRYSKHCKHRFATNKTFLLKGTLFDTHWAIARMRKANALGRPNRAGQRGGGRDEKPTIRFTPS